MVTTASNGQLVDQMRDAIGAARQASQLAPGQLTLARLAGATDPAVRKALELLATEIASARDPGEITGPVDKPPVASPFVDWWTTGGLGRLRHTKLGSPLQLGSRRWSSSPGW